MRRLGIARRRVRPVRLLLALAACGLSVVGTTLGGAAAARAVDSACPLPASPLGVCPTPPSPPPGVLPAPPSPLPLPGLAPGILPTGPALPPQPGVPFTGCTGSRGPAPQGGDVIYGEHTTIAKDNQDGPYPDYHVVIDPWLPCVAYRTGKLANCSGTGGQCSGPAQEVDRSTDGGSTWTKVFFDARSGVTGAPFALGAMTVGPPSRPGGPGVVWLGETGNGNSALVSRDGGQTWTIASNGLAGAAVVNIWVSPANPSYVWAQLRSPSVDAATIGVARYSWLLAFTTDGGASWFPAALPPTTVRNFADNNPGRVDVAMDPASAATIFVLWPQSPQAYTIYTSTDAGRTTSPLHGGAGIGRQLVAAPRPTGGLRLYLLLDHPGQTLGPAAQLTIGSQVSMSDDGGITWTTPPNPILSAGDLTSWLLVDPLDSDRALLVEHIGDMGQFGDGTVAYYTGDGFATHGVVPLRLPAIPTYNLIRSPLDPATETRYTPLPADAAGFGFQVDRSGTFYVTIIGVNDPYPRSSAYTPRTPAHAGTVVSQWYFRLARPDGTAASPGDLLSAPSQPAVPLGRACQVSGVVWTLTYDGVSLLYVDPAPNGYFNGNGFPNSAANTTYTTPADEMHVHRINPADCSVQPDLRIHFAPADLDAIAAQYGGSCHEACTHPWITSGDAHHPSADALSYDQLSGSLVFALDYVRSGTTHDHQNTAPRPTPLFRAVLAPGASDAMAAPAFPVTSCTGHYYTFSTLAFDNADGTTWGCDGTGRLNHMSPTGEGLGTCMSAVLHQSTSEIGNWLIPGAERLIELYSNTQVVEFDRATCAPSRVRNLPVYDGPSGYTTEGLACDPLTFQGSPLGASAGLWVADPYQKTIAAYQMPADTCPLLTRTQLSAHAPGSALPLTTVGPGTRVCLDASLRLRGAGRAIASQPVQFLVDGSPVGTQATGPAGATSCVPWSASGEGQHTIEARYAGDGTRYLGSAAAATLAVLAPLGPPLPGPGSVPPPPPPPPALRPGADIVPPPPSAPSVQAFSAPSAVQPVQGQANQATQTTTQTASALEREQQHQLALAVAHNADPDEATAPAGGDGTPAQDGVPQSGAADRGPAQSLPGAMGVVTTLTVMASLALTLGLWYRREHANAAAPAGNRRATHL